MLTLRSETKQLFADAGLPEFTIGRNTLNHLAIVGPCGKPIVEVTNFPVGSKLTKGEREITINDYLTPILLEHAKVIQAMIKFKTLEAETKETVEAAVDAESGKDKIKAQMAQSGYGDFKKYAGFIIFDNCDDDAVDLVKVSVDAEGDYKIISEGSNATIIKGNLGLAVELRNRLEVLHKLYGKHVDARSKFEEANESMVKECAL